tara:strand:- start:897 stop:1628 length:732 start_codon:yes stop_codon:yes gene_type:complete
MAWWLVDSILKGTFDEDYPIMKKSEKDVTIVGGGGTDSIEIKGGVDTISIDQSWWEDDGHSLVGNPYYSASADDTITFNVPTGAVAAADTISLNFTGSHLPGGMGEDHISFSGYAGTAFDSPEYYADGVNSYPIKPQPNLTGPSNQKYQEDKGIADLKSYVASTYQGHYTNENSDVQTLDLIHSVGDAESFCRSNALKYLSRYDKKGSAKNDILKAMHYCLLLYYFSGNTQEPDYTNTRYETF